VGVRSVARTLRCSHCAASFSVPELAPEVHCPFCGRRQAVATLHGELAGYQLAVAGDLEAAQRERQHAAAWERWSTHASPGKTLAVAFGFTLGLPLALTLVGYALLSSGRVDGPYLSFGIMGSTYLGVILYVIWYATTARTRRAARVTAGETAVACPRCGAPGALTAGQAIDECGYCHAALIPSQTMIMRSLDAVRRVAWQARMDRHRSERTGMARAMSSSAASYVIYIAFAPVALSLVGASIVFTSQMLRGQTPWDPAIVGLWGFSATMLGGGVAYFLYRRGKRRAWHAAFADLARQFRGRVLPRMTDWIEWLNTHWAGAYPLERIFQGPYGCAAALDGQGFPVLVIADGSDTDRYRPRRLEIMLAAWVPGMSDGAGTRKVPAGEGAAAHDWLSAHGFTVEFTEAGLRAIADRATVTKLHRHPGKAHELAPAISALATAASSVGAYPVA
jgi:DNA-directed RNA polymerase subunit RPC12/RpoP